MLDTSSTIMAASRQWASRPQDQRFVSLHEMGAFLNHQRDVSRQMVISSRGVEARPAAGDEIKGLEIVARGTDHAFNPTHWSTGQIATLAGAPAGYLRTLPAPLAADCINYGLKLKRDVEDVGLLVRENGTTELAAATGPNYGRVWNSDIADALIRNFGDGISGDWRVPGEFGNAVQVNKGNTTLYASDRDMFVFLADETNRIEMPNRRNGEKESLARGFFVWNSEVGSATLGISMFLFDYVCCNRIVWGARDYKEIKIWHTAGAPDRFLERIVPVLENYQHSEAKPVEDTIKAAQAAKLDSSLADFLKARRYGNGTVKAIAQAHEAEEDRPIETIWDVVTGITAHAKSIGHQDERVALERDAGKILDLVAVR